MDVTRPALSENFIKMDSVPPYSGSVQRDYMQLSVVFIPVELGQRCSFFGIIENNSMPIVMAIPALFGIRRSRQFIAFRTQIQVHLVRVFFQMRSAHFIINSSGPALSKSNTSGSLLN